MYQFFILLMLLCAVMFIVSLIRPRWGTFGKKPEWKRKRLCPFYFVLFIAFALLSNYTMPEDVRIANQQRQEQRHPWSDQPPCRDPESAAIGSR